MKKIYLLKSDEHYKIGVTRNNINKRIKQLQTGNSKEIKLITFYESEFANKIESILHNMYSYTKESGEWFNLSLIDEKNFINQCETIEKNIKYLIKEGNKFI